MALGEFKLFQMKSKSKERRKQRSMLSGHSPMVMSKEIN